MRIVMFEQLTQGIDFTSILKSIVTTEVSMVDLVIGLVGLYFTWKVGKFGVRTSIAGTKFLAKTAATGVVAGTKSGGNMLGTLIAATIKRYYAGFMGLGALATGVGLGGLTEKAQYLNGSGEIIGGLIGLGLFGVIYGIGSAAANTDPRKSYHS